MNFKILIVIEFNKITNNIISEFKINLLKKIKVLCIKSSTTDSHLQPLPFSENSINKEVIHRFLEINSIISKVPLRHQNKLPKHFSSL